MPIKITSEAGLTLIETMLALLVFSVGILAAASMQITCLQSNIRAKSASKGSQAASTLIEKMQMLPFEDSLLADIDGDYDLQNPDFGPVLSDDASTILEWEIQDGSPAPGLKRITVTARWNIPRGQMVDIRYNLVRAKDYQ